MSCCSRGILLLSLSVALTTVSFAAPVEITARWINENGRWLVRIEPVDNNRVRTTKFLGDSPALRRRGLFQVTDAASGQRMNFRLERRGENGALSSIDLTFPEIDAPRKITVRVSGLMLQAGEAEAISYEGSVTADPSPGGKYRRSLAAPTPTPSRQLASEPSGGATSPNNTFAGPLPGAGEPTASPAGTAAAGQSGGRSARMPQFPFPPPPASANETVPRDLLVGAKEDPQLRDVDLALSAAFRQCSYGEKSYYAVPNGFAIASRIEQMNADGSPNDDRWSMDVTPLRKFSVEAYLRALFRARPGHYRVIVFLVTDQPFEQEGPKVTSKQAALWVASGFNKLPRDVGEQPLSEDHSCTALIYEFSRVGGGEPTFVEPSQVTGELHLQKSGLLAALRGQ